MAVLPMFPLGSVLFPGQLLPLHVFEPRYRQLVIDLLADDDHPPEFGVVLIERGWEVGGGDERTDVGTVARMTQCEALDDGRYAIVAVGVRRLRVNAWLPDDPYPLADVDELEDLPDDEHDDDALALQVAASTVRLRQTMRSIVEAQQEDAPRPGSDAGDATSTDPDVPELVVSDDPRLATFHLAAQAPVGPVDRYRMLAAPTAMARLEALDRALDDVDAVLAFHRS